MKFIPIVTIVVSCFSLYSCLGLEVVHSPKVADLIDEINANETTFQASLSDHFVEVNLHATTNKIDTVKAKKLFRLINLASSPARYKTFVFDEDQQLDFMMYHTGDIAYSKIYLFSDYEF